MSTGHFAARAAAVGTGVVVLGGLLAATPATAGGRVATGCPVERNYAVTSISTVHHSLASARLKDGPGPATVKVKVERSGTLHHSISVSGEASVSGVIAQAKVSTGASVAKTASITVGHEVTKKVPSGKYLQSRYGSYGKKFNWRYYRVNGSCSTTTLATGYSDWAPTNEKGWKFTVVSR
ncbi:hypothetical protein ACLQ2N_27595 [Streptomyces sp. DT224]|uniref:hypothetical protein n=1 Tax=Streptomyces sp. DT224 TaxID=3393426 RepID=UPI003CFB7A64